MKQRTTLFKLTYFKRGEEICGDDLFNTKSSIFINLKHLVSLSEPKDYILPFSGNKHGDFKYSQLKLSNNDVFYISDRVYDALCTSYLELV